MVDKSHLDEEALEELRDVMDEEFESLIQTYLEDSKARIESLNTALRAGDPDAFAHTAHSFKGSCINMGAPFLAELCREAEKTGKDERLSEAPSVLSAIETEFQWVAEAIDTLMDRGA